MVILKDVSYSDPISHIKYLKRRSFWETCKFLEECYCWVATSEISRNIFWKFCIKMCYLYIKRAIY